MPRTARKMIQIGYPRDETDRMPNNISISDLDIIMYIVAIIGHFVDLALDINVAVRYSLERRMMEFGLTLTFILLPAFVNTAVSIRMYSLDKQQDSLSYAITKRKLLRIFILVLQMAPILRFADALIYAIKSRYAERRKDPLSQRMYYALMLKEDSDAALLRIFECFLEAAPQQVLQTSLLLRQYDHLAIHQALSICSSIVGMGWCLAAYQRAIRFTQEDKNNVTWSGTALQTAWHFLVSLSRVISISLIAHLYPQWTVLACILHIVTMSIWLQLYDKSPFCSQNILFEVAFSLTLGSVYLFTYILPNESKTRYRYTVYYTICFLQNVTCATLWFIYSDDVTRSAIYFYPVLVLSVVPFVLGIIFMILYYAFLHPKTSGNGLGVTYNAQVEVVDVS
ncbi:XK-related protein 7 [Melitaea cinxia]|uniref:XK-related protein 7 n=1 Tax=Melitaea cinxia TaxID=113334 RepID=UPI001E2718A0|nr:XK-related protein 7 [Melitaea cinxia]